jgi:uncharacterized protein
VSLPPPAPEAIALVTGASSGIGEQFARQPVARGHRVALVARREDRLAALAEELGGSDRAVAIAADLGVEADRDRLAARLEELGARVDVLVNNAGFGVYEPFGAAGREGEVQQVRVLVEAVVDLMALYLRECSSAARERSSTVIDDRVSTAAVQRRLRGRQGAPAAAVRGRPR